mmetsp:Transcript_8917/g.16563  ORF Transcript_8917/g.16563 Transcript_8917/m.16563 type:complete len:798 (+) Transcript_8917:142-2535(+)
MEEEPVQMSMTMTQSQDSHSLSVEYGGSCGVVNTTAAPSVSMEDYLRIQKALQGGELVLKDFETQFKSQMSAGGVWGSVQKREEDEEAFGIRRSSSEENKSSSSSSEEGLVETLKRVETVRSGYTDHLKASVSEPMALLFEKILAESRSIVFSVVITSAPATLWDRVRSFYGESFKAFIETCESREEFPLGYNETIFDVMGSEWCSRLSFVGQTLNKLGLGSRNESIYTDIVFTHLKGWLEERAAGEYTKECLLMAQTYNQKVIMSFVWLLLESSDDSSSSASGGGPAGQHQEEMIKQWRTRLDTFIYEILGRMRSDEMFDIVVDFPESMQALRDLKVCLEHTNFTSTFIEKFSAQLRKRLLHLGAATPVIVTQYISSIKALNILDPSGILTEIICPLVKNYIKKRKDTTRCIVNMVVYDENLLSLKEENEEESFYSGEGQEEDLDDIDVVLKEMKWNPVPIQAAQLFNTVKKCNKDIVAALIDVLGNKEYFIKEYKMVLAERLLAKVDDDIDDETRILELLKLRFGANSLRDCEIMLKDMADSKRITSNIRALVQPSASAHGSFIPEFSSVIISELFWPPLFEGKVRTPSHVHWMLDAFGAQYKALKAPRTLHWKPHLGVVDLELAFGKGTKEFTVSVAQALIISQFESKGTWDSEELAKAVGIEVEALSEKASIWVNSGILRKSVDSGSKNQVYKLIEDIEDHVEKPYAHTKPDISVMSQEQQMEMNMKVYESYVMGMVTNLESLPLEKIHNMLKMFVLEPVYDKTIAELEAFLAKLVSDGKLTFDGLVYRKKKR